ncbi:cell division protein PerM [Nocardioides sp. AN3]
MTSLLPSSARSSDQVRADLRHRRPLVVVATLGGVVAACATLLVCLALGVVGWFLTDAGAHGAPRDALRVGALAWLMAHGSGIHVNGTAVTVVPLGLTAIVGWAMWRVGHRVGDSISGHGPDADRIADGERDWTVQLATGLFTLGYAVTVIVTASVAADAATAPSLARALVWTILGSALVGGTGIAVGSGRAAIAVAWLPPTIRAAASAARDTLIGWLAISLAVLLVSLAVDWSTAANVMSQLHTSAGAATLYTAVTAAVLPNAALFSGSYLLGPGFTVGIGTLVSPGAVVLGPLPMFPLLAALPDAGSTPAWATWLILLAPLTAAVGVVRAQRRYRTTRWDEGAVRGLAGGVCAGVGFGILAGLAGGAVGPGRMTQVAPYAMDACVRGVLAFGIGGLLAGLAMTWWQRRSS